MLPVRCKQVNKNQPATERSSKGIAVSKRHVCQKALFNTAHFAIIDLFQFGLCYVVHKIQILNKY